MILEGENDGPMLKDGLALGVTLPEGKNSDTSTPKSPTVAVTLSRGCAPTIMLLVRAREKDQR